MEIKLIKKISLINEKKWRTHQDISSKTLNEAIYLALKQVNYNVSYFKENFPSPQTFDNTYKKQGNIEWTNGFWTGILWLSFELSNQSMFENLATTNIHSFMNRIDKKIEVNHHDLGFLYSLSCVAGWKVSQNNIGKKAALIAADELLKRYQDKGDFIQAWGNNGETEDYRLIIDALLNIPILYWASEETKKPIYKEKALNHFYTAVNTTIRDDATSYHTYFFSKENGKPLYGKTKQGFSDDSCWARGQAWAIYGIPLSIKYEKGLIKNENLLNMFKSVTNHFLNNSSKDNVAFWDLIFKEGDNHSKDSSAAAIAACGMLEMAKFLEDTKEKELYVNAAKIIAASLIKNYSNKKVEEGRPLLLHGVYSYHSQRGNKGIDEGNIWGDYFYLELLTRLKKEWKTYW